MKKLQENQKIALFEASAFLFSLLALIFLCLPAYWEAGGFTLSLGQMIFGNSKTDFNAVLFLGFLFLLVGSLGSLALALLSFFKKFNSDRNVTIIAIVSAVLILVGGILLACGIFITGLDKQNSELGFLQGNWGIAAGNILVPICALVAFFLSYPAAWIVLHHKDLEDQEKKAEATAK